MKVAILCGGLGTRMREETEYRPKPLVTVGNRPILWHIMKIYAHYGFKDFAVCLGYRGEMIKEYFLNYAAMSSDFTIHLGQESQITYHNNHGERDFQVTLADTGLETMTGGRVRRVGKYLDEETFMVTYGDGLADVNVKELVEFHRSHGRLATVTAVRPISRFGVLDLNDDGCVGLCREKPVVDSWISAGFFVFQKPVLDYIDGDQCVLEQEFLRRLVSEKQLIAYRHHGFFYCIDTYREYLGINEMWDRGQTPWKVWDD
jgi:glucose-1-phosphate cytidylyltransferase